MQTTSDFSEVDDSGQAQLTALMLKQTTFAES